MHEFDLIARHFAPLSHPEFGLNLKDDAALLDIPEGEQLVITTDTLNEAIHFIGNEAAELIARKALRVNLSDLAAMGATPLGYTLNIAAPKTCDDHFFAGLSCGLKEDQANFNLSLLGGDTTATQGPISLTITAYGTVPKGHALTRKGAQIGDAIYVGGTLGEAALGLAIAQGTQPQNEALLARYQLPTPQLSLGKSLRNIATSCMDISDGFIQDLGHLCAASKRGARIDLAAIPCASDDVERCLTGGDDYVLLFTAPANISLPHTQIGHITEAKEILFLDETDNAITFEKGGYRHF